MLEDDADDEPPPDGRSFEAVTRFEEPDPADPDDDTLGPSIPDTTAAEADVHPRVQLLFWALVAVFNIAVLALGVGVLLIVFTDDAVLAVQVLAAGVALFAYGAYRYRDAKDEVAALTGGEEKG